MRHTDFATMFEYAAGLGTKAARVGLEAHLMACERCARDAATARRLVETVRADRMSEPPPARRGRARLRGQILSRSPGATLPAGSKARLRRLGGGGAVVELDCHGAFESGPLAAGRYRLTVRGGSMEIVVDRLDLN